MVYAMDSNNSVIKRCGVLYKTANSVDPDQAAPALFVYAILSETLVY